MEDSSNDASASNVVHVAVLELPIDQIYVSPHQMRRQFEGAALQDLARSMKQEGLIQPITVRPVGNAYELVAGERRLRAAQLLKWEVILARVIRVNDEGAAVKGLIENLQRSDLNPLEQARGFKQLSGPPYNLTREAIAQRVGRSQTCVARCLALLDLPPEIQELIPRGVVTETHTRALRKITDRAQQIATARLADREGWNVKETERRVRDWLKQAGQLENRRGNLRQKPAPPRQANGLESDPLANLWPSLLCVSKRKGGGAWNVRYGGAGRWTFEVWATSQDPQSTLAEFFIRLGKTLNNGNKA